MSLPRPPAPSLEPERVQERGRNSHARPGTKNSATKAASCSTWTLPATNPSMNGGHSSTTGTAGHGTERRRQVQIATASNKTSQAPRTRGRRTRQAVELRHEVHAVEPRHDVAQVGRELPHVCQLAP